MLWLQHIFAVGVLAHMLWAAVLLEKEWRRIRRFARSADQQGSRHTPSGLARSEASQASTMMR
jgi:hypothetical protein